MLKNYVLVALRNFRKFKTYSFINIFGLAIGLACCILILLHIYDELNFDRFHEKADRLFRVIQVRSGSQGEQHLAYTMGPFGPALVNEFPEVEASARLFQGWRLTVKREAAGPTGQIVRKNFFTDASFFDLFDFQLLAGDRKTALSTPGSVVLTEPMAKQLFGDEEPLGKSLQIEAEDFPEFVQTAFTVTGVLRDIPHTSHLNFDLLISQSTLDRFADVHGWFTDWNNTIVITYVLLRNPFNQANLEAKLAQFNLKHRGEEAARNRFYLQPLNDIHFGSAEIESEYNIREGQVGYVYVFAAIALFLAAIACINYMNLATARSMKRAKEVGLRKVVGANRSQMIVQFLTESILSAVIAFLLAIGLVEAMLPSFNALAGANLSLRLAGNTSVFLGLLGLVLLIGIVAGSYPAFYLSRLAPAAVLKGELKAGAQRSRLRQSLVVAQFALSILMIVATLVVFQQLDYVRHKQLGFNQDQLVVIDINHDDVQSNFLTIKNEFKRHAAVRGATVSSRVPGDWKYFRRIRAVREGQAETEAQQLYFNGIDEDFIGVYEIDLVQGRNFSRALATDSTAVILNETAARALFADSPVGQAIRVPAFNFTGRVIGVVRDFHFHSLHGKIEPMVMGFMPAGGRHAVHGIDYFSLRIAAENVQESIDFITKVHAQFDAINPIEYAFLNHWWIDLYTRDERLGRIFGIAAGLAILIACVGLFGLAAFMAEQRTKEIGVRKVLGASISSLVMLLSKDFTRFVLLGLLAATPLAYFVMNKWLQNFAYRIEIGWWVFLLAGVMAMLIALATVCTQAIKAALANPVESLRYE